LFAGFGALRVDQLEALLLLHDTLTQASRRVATYRVLAELRERAFVETVGLAGRPGPGRAFVLSPAGRRVYAASDPLYPRRRIGRATSVVMLDHAVALADIAVAFASAAHRDGVELLWESDWEALTRLQATIVIPDALVTLRHDGWRTRGCIEADRATERHQAFARKVRRYVDLYLGDRWRAELGYWPQILTVTTSDQRARSLADLAHDEAVRYGGARIAKSFRFISFAELAAHGPFAVAWHVGGGVGREFILASHVNSARACPPQQGRSDVATESNLSNGNSDGTR
jgi:hypothetical protein